MYTLDSTRRFRFLLRGEVTCYDRACPILEASWCWSNRIMQLFGMRNLSSKNTGCLYWNWFLSKDIKIGLWISYYLPVFCPTVHTNFMISKWHPEMQHLHPQKKQLHLVQFKSPSIEASQPSTRCCVSSSLPSWHSFLHHCFIVPAFGPKSCLMKKCAKSMPAATPCREKKTCHMETTAPAQGRKI